MLRQLLTGTAVCIGTIAIHALVMTTVVRVALAVDARDELHVWFRLTAVMIATVFVLMLAHLSEVLVWAAVYAMVGAMPADADLVYAAFVNYTTLGYGDVIPVQRWLLLGPMAAMDGILLFGWSTAVIFAVMRRTMLQTHLRGGSGADSE